MHSDLDREISEFFEQVLRIKDEIYSLLQGHEHFQRILLLSLLDALAQCAFPMEKGNKTRFVSLIDCYSHWQDKDRVSLLQMRYLLAKKSCDPFTHLKEEVERLIEKWPASRILRSEEADPLVAELAKFDADQCQKVINKCRYAAVLWDLRNFAVHEFRMPESFGMDFGIDNSTPYYHQATGLSADGKAKERTWELYFPNHVISQIVSSCSTNLRADFQVKVVNPWNNFTSSSRWAACDC